MAALYETLSARPSPSTPSYNGVSYKERFSYKVNAYFYQYKSLYQEFMSHYNLWLQISVTKTPYKTNIMRIFKEHLLWPEVLYYHNKLWLPPSTKTLSVTSQNFFPVATTNYGCPHLQITSLWLLRCCFVCPQQTMTSQMLFPVATTNYSCPHLQIPSLWILDHFRVTISH